ncbi:Uncharacterized protein Rs2_03096 [Raphanus sativus]|nr:Uncharacterized protein Rs2_03096 [Raphanus sativus]
MEKERTQTPPSQEFQDALSNTQAEGTEVISDPVDVDNGLNEVRGLTGDKDDLLEEELMDIDEMNAYLLEHGIDIDAENYDHEFSEEGLDEEIREQEVLTSILEEKAEVGNEKEAHLVDKDMAKAEGTKKKGGKPAGSAASTAVSTKLRIANALRSPRKRAPAKPGTRQGGNIKRMEEKGMANPKDGHQKK